MTHILDDKSEHVLPFILKHYEQHRRQQGPVSRPMIVGLQGIQGAGKTTLVETLHSTLSSSPYNLNTLVFSIDDLYLPHHAQEDLAKQYSDNPLVQHRGVPGTHDVNLGVELFDALEQQKPDIALPSYDKSAYQGAGDRRPRASWKVANAGGQRPIDLVIFEGWCVGFRALSNEVLLEKWRTAADQHAGGVEYQGELGKHKFDHVEFMNQALKRYNVITDRFACFVQIDAENPQYVYEWRTQQEAALRRQTGAGMTDDQVIKFVNGYYPAYELYTAVLREGIFVDSGKQLRLVVGQDRRVVNVLTL